MANIDKSKIESFLQKQIDALSTVGIPATSKAKFQELKKNLDDLRKYT
jgi:hypothetical protein